MGVTQWVLGLKADSSGVKTGVNSAIADFERLGNRAEAINRRIAKSTIAAIAASAATGKGAKLAAFLAGPAGTVSMIEAASLFFKSSKFAFGLNDQAVKKNIGVDLLQKLQAVSNVNGSDIDSTVSGYKGVKEALEKGKGGDADAIKNLKELGLTLEQINTLDAEQAFYAIADGMDAATLSTDKYKSAVAVGLEPILENLKKGGTGTTGRLMDYFKVHPGDIQELTEVEVRLKNIGNAIQNFGKISKELSSQGGKSALTGFGGAVVSLTNRLAASLVGASAYLGPAGSDWRKNRTSEAEALQMRVNHQHDQSLPLSENDVDPDTTRLNKKLEEAQIARGVNDQQAEEDLINGIMDELFSPENAQIDKLDEQNQKKKFRLQYNSLNGTGRKKLLGGEIARLKRQIATEDDPVRQAELQGDLYDAQNDMVSLDGQQMGRGTKWDSNIDTSEHARAGLYEGVKQTQDLQQRQLDTLQKMLTELRGIHREATAE